MIYSGQGTSAIWQSRMWTEASQRLLWASLQPSRRWYLCGWVGSNCILVDTPRKMQFGRWGWSFIWVYLQINSGKGHEMSWSSNNLNIPATEIWKTWSLFSGEQEAPHLVLPSWGGTRDWWPPRTRSLGCAQFLLHLKREVVSWRSVCIRPKLNDNPRCTAAHFKNMRMVFDTTFCGLEAAALKCIKQKSESNKKRPLSNHFLPYFLAKIMLRFVGFPGIGTLKRILGDYAGASFSGYCGWTNMQCEAYVRSKPNDFSDSEMGKNW